MSQVLLTFSLIFLAALPGRTTFILILLSASVRPWRMLAGAIPAFVVQCGVAVLVGQALKNLPHMYIAGAAGLLFLYFAVRFWLESRHKENLSEKVQERSIGSIFALFFLAELGDVSQLAVAAQAAQIPSGLAVFLGSSLAMTSIAVLCAFAGRLLAKVVRPSTLQKCAAAIFFVLGGYILFTAFKP